MLDWDGLRTLLALSRAGSFAGAGKALKVDHSTVGRRIAALERAFGQPLVIRTPDGVAITAAGHAACEAAERMEEAVLVAERRIAGERMQARVVTLTTTDGFSDFLVGRFAPFCIEHPELRLDIVTNNDPVDLSRGEADVALRMFQPTEPSLVARRIGTIGWSLYASDDYVARRGRPTLADLGGHALLGYDEALAHAAGARWLAQNMPDAGFVLRAQAPRAVAAAAAAGMGVGIIPCFYAQGEPRLRRVTAAVLIESEVFAVVHNDLRNVPQVRLVVEQLAAMFRADRALLRGDIV